MEDAVEKIERAELFDNAITDALAFNLFGKGPEQTVPDDEGAGIIGVEISRVGGVMDAVVAGRVHDIFKPARQFSNGFGMDPELVDQIDSAAEQYHRRVKAQKGKRNTEDKAKREKARPCLPQRG